MTSSTLLIVGGGLLIGIAMFQHNAGAWFPALTGASLIFNGALLRWRGL